MFNLHKKQSLPEIFAQYAGVEIPYKVTEKTFLTEQKKSEMTPEEIEEFKEKFPALYKSEIKKPNEDGLALLKEIYETAQKNNVHLRLFTPGSMGTMDVQHSRLNMHIREDEDGKWRIQPTCDYG